MATAADVVSHWHISFPDFTTSSLAFYSSIESAITEKQATTVRTERIDISESGVLSAKRTYLRVSYGRFSFDLCAAPFGKDFLFSWWLIRRKSENVLLVGCLGMLGILGLYALLANFAGAFLGLLLTVCAVALGIITLQQNRGETAIIVEDLLFGLPLIGPILERALKPTTYYSTDSRLIFEESVHRIVIAEVESLLAGKGGRVLAPEETRAHSRDPLR